jgi:hypothetical protein
VLAGDAQRNAAGDEDLQPWAGGKEGGKARRGRDDLLDIVEHEQRLIRPQRRRKPLGKGRSAAVRHAHRLGDGREHEAGIAQACKRDNHHHRKGVAEVRGDLEGEPRFAHAAGSGQGHERHVVAQEERANLHDFALPPDQRGARERQTCGVRRDRHGRDLGRWTVGRAMIASVAPRRSVHRRSASPSGNGRLSPI